VAESTSARAALDMNAFGVTNVKTMLGGWNEWIAKGNKIQKK
jgi:3-mercaptopyruvate sulfurtransferase SseA